MDTMLNSKSGRVVAIFSVASLVIFESALAVIMIHRWSSIAESARSWFVSLGFAFAMLWYSQLSDKGKNIRLGWTCLAAVAALWVIMNPR